MPAAKPAALRLLNGRGDGKDAAGRTVVSVPSDREAPARPAGLPPEARREWDRVVPLLDKLGVVAGNLHRGVLMRYVTAWADFVELQADVRKHGRTMTVVVRGNDGSSQRKRVVRPEVKLLSEARTELHRLTGELGLSPRTEAAAYASAQSNIAKGGDDTPNPFASGK